MNFKNNVCHVENQSPQPLESKFELSLPDITAINQALDIKFPRESDVEIMSDPFMEQNIFGSFSTNKPVNSRRQKLHQNESNRPSKCKDVCCEPGASADLYKSNGYKPSDLGRGLGVLDAGKIDPFVSSIENDHFGTVDPVFTTTKNVSSCGKPMTDDAGNKTTCKESCCASDITLLVESGAGVGSLEQSNKRQETTTEIPCCRSRNCAHSSIDQLDNDGLKIKGAHGIIPKDAFVIGGVIIKRHQVRFGMTYERTIF